MSENMTVYSIQRTYTLKVVVNPKKSIVTCDERIDIPTIEPLPRVPSIFNEFMTVIPCIELAGELLGDILSECNFTFETNEGVTVLPIKIPSGEEDPFVNPYSNFRYVLVLPKGATGVKSCEIIHKETGKEVQHNFTFGIMPPPYNYDNALFGYYAGAMLEFYLYVRDNFSRLHLTTKTPPFASIDLPKGAGKQTIKIEPGVLFYNTGFLYPMSSEPTTHKPKIILHGAGRDQVYTLSLNKTTNTVSIDLFTGMITVYADVTGEIIQQFKLALPYLGFETLSFENFDDINDSYLHVIREGALVRYE